MRISLLQGRLARPAIATVVFIGLVLPGSVLAQTTRAHSPAIKYGGTVTIAPGPRGSWTQNFNPLISTDQSLPGTQGFIYEPLILFNLAKGGKPQPWLAKSWKFSNGLKTLTFHLRPGVKWSDGKPFTSRDVAFSINLAKKWPAVPCGNCQASVKSVSAPNATTAVVRLKYADTTMLYYLGETLFVVPQHVWSKVQGDPTKFLNPNPVATGPFAHATFSPQVYTLHKNTHYWQTGKPYVSALRFPAYSGNDAAQLALVNGDVDWGGIFIPNAESVYIGAHPKTNHTWYAPYDTPRALWLNTAEAPFNNVHVRRAISLAIDRTALDKQAEYGYAPPTNGLLLEPQFTKKWGVPSLLTKWAPVRANVAAAKAELAKAGNVDLSKTYKLQVVDGWSDWDSSVQLMVSQLAAIGMKVQYDPLQFGDYFSNMQLGKYDMSISWTDGGPTPFYRYRDSFLSSNTKPVGQTAQPGWSRWTNTQMDNLLNQYTHAASQKSQVTIMKKAETLYASQLPIIPLFAGDFWYEYNTSRFVGWPNARKPYTRPAPYNYPDIEDVILHVHKK
jgi:peptide/nickel transport system substrate-binding protein